MHLWTIDQRRSYRFLEDGALTELLNKISWSCWFLLLLASNVARVLKSKTYTRLSFISIGVISFVLNAFTLIWLIFSWQMFLMMSITWLSVDKHVGSVSILGVRWTSTTSPDSSCSMRAEIIHDGKQIYQRCKQGNTRLHVVCIRIMTLHGIGIGTGIKFTRIRIGTGIKKLSGIGIETEIKNHWGRPSLILHVVCVMNYWTGFCCMKPVLQATLNNHSQQIFLSLLRGHNSYHAYWDFDFMPSRW